MVSSNLHSMGLLHLLDDLRPEPSYLDVVLNEVTADPDWRIDLLDIGCGTGRGLGDLAEQRQMWRCWGIDVNELLIAHASESYPEVVFSQADVIEADLGRTFTAITCLGQVLSYLETDDQVAQACHTFARHSREGTHLIVDTLPKAVSTTEDVRDFDTAQGPVQVRTTSTVRTLGHLSTTRRWTFKSSGQTITQLFSRRAIHPDELVWHLEARDFKIVSSTGLDGGRITAQFKG